MSTLFHMGFALHPRVAQNVISSFHATCTCIGNHPSWKIYHFVLEYHSSTIRQTDNSAATFQNVNGRSPEHEELNSCNI